MLEGSVDQPFFLEIYQILFILEDKYPLAGIGPSRSR